MTGLERIDQRAADAEKRNRADANAKEWLTAKCKDALEDALGKEGVLEVKLKK